MNPVTSRKAAANLFWITRGLFSTLRALRPLDMLVNVFFIGIAVALPTLRSCARYELFFFPPNKKLWYAENETQVGRAKDGK